MNTPNAKESFLRKLYYDPKEGLTNAEKQYHKVKDEGYTMKEVKEFIEKQETGQRYRQLRKKELYPITGPAFSYQADLIFYPRTKRINNGYDTALTIIEVTSRRGYVYKMKGKTVKEVTRVFKLFFEKDKVEMKNLITDRGSEFISKGLKDLLEKHKISHVTADEGDHSKMGMIERFNRTIKALISKYQTTYNTKKWIDAIDDLVYNYNHTVHSSTGYAPAKVGLREMALIRMIANRRTWDLDKEKDINVGDKVRLLERKPLFGKEGAKWSEEVYSVTKDYGKSFKVNDKARRYKHNEVLKVIEPIEKNPYPRVIKSPDIETQLEKVRGTRRIRTERLIERPSTRRFVASQRESQK